MFCKNCGATLKDGVKFCRGCGAKTGEIAAAQPQRQAYASVGDAPMRDPLSQYQPQTQQLRQTQYTQPPQQYQQASFAPVGAASGRPPVGDAPLRVPPPQTRPQQAQPQTRPQQAQPQTRPQQPQPQTRPQQAQYAQPTAPKFCKGCGNTLKPGAKFCKGCGKAVPAAATPAPTAQPTTPKFCKGCGNALKPGAKFCKGCGKAVAAASVGAASGRPSQQQYATQPHYAQHPQYPHPHAAPRQKAGAPDPRRGPIVFSWQSLKNALRGIATMFKKPSVLLPMIVIIAIQTALSFIKIDEPMNRLVTFFSFLTFAQGGMYGGFIGAVGGIIGRGIFAWAVSSIVMSLFNQGKKQKKPPAPKVATYGAASRAILGLGLGLVAYNFLTGDASLENAIIGVTSAIACFRAAKNKQGYTTGLLSSFTGGRLTPVAVCHIISGIAVGMLCGTLSSLAVSGYWCYLIGAGIAFIGLIFTLLGKNAPRYAAACLALGMTLATPLAMIVTARAAEETSGYWRYVSKSIVEDYTKVSERYIASYSYGTYTEITTENGVNNEFKVTITHGLLPEIIRPGETFTIPYTIASSGRYDPRTSTGAYNTALFSVYAGVRDAAHAATTVIWGSDGAESASVGGNIEVASVAGSAAGEKKEFSQTCGVGWLDNVSPPRNRAGIIYIYEWVVDDDAPGGGGGGGGDDYDDPDDPGDYDDPPYAPDYPGGPDDDPNDPTQPDTPTQPGDPTRPDTPPRPDDLGNTDGGGHPGEHTDTAETAAVVAGGAVAALIGIGAGLTEIGDDKRERDCEHYWGPWEMVRPPTYTQDGLEASTCQICGVVWTRPIPAAEPCEHDWGDWEETTPATYTTDGVETRTCYICGAVQQRPIPRECDHDWSEWEETTPATDAADGVETRTCSECGAVETRPIPYEKELTDAELALLIRQELARIERKDWTHHQWAEQDKLDLLRMDQYVALRNKLINTKEGDTSFAYRLAQYIEDNIISDYYNQSGDIKVFNTEAIDNMQRMVGRWMNDDYSTAEYALDTGLSGWLRLNIETLVEGTKMSAEEIARGESKKAIALQLLLMTLPGGTTIESALFVARSYYIMKDYVEGGGDSALDAFAESMKELAKEVAFEKAIGIAIKGGGKIAGAAADSSVSKQLLEQINASPQLKALMDKAAKKLDDTGKALNTDVSDFFKKADNVAATTPKPPAKPKLTGQEIDKKAGDALSDPKVKAGTDVHRQSIEAGSKKVRELESAAEQLKKTPNDPLAIQRHREAVMNVQSDKYALAEINNTATVSNQTRAEFNAAKAKVDEEIIQKTKERLADELNLSVGKPGETPKVGDIIDYRATNVKPAGGDVTVGRDLDVTYRQVVAVDANGKVTQWKDIDKADAVIRPIQEREVYNAWHGQSGASDVTQAQMKQFHDAMDYNPINKWSMDAYTGSEDQLKKILQSGPKDITHVGSVTAAMKDKSVEFYEKATAAANRGDLAKAAELQMEGIRQATKQYDNILVTRVNEINRAAGTTKVSIPTDIENGINILKRVGTTPPNNLSPAQAEALLGEMGSSVEKITEAYTEAAAYLYTLF